MKRNRIWLTTFQQARLPDQHSIPIVCLTFSSVLVSVYTEVLWKLNFAPYIKEDVALALGNRLLLALGHGAVVEVVPLTCNVNQPGH